MNERCEWWTDQRCSSGPERWSSGVKPRCLWLSLPSLAPIRSRCRSASTRQETPQCAPTDPSPYPLPASSLITKHTHKHLHTRREWWLPKLTHAFLQKQPQTSNILLPVALWHVFQIKGSGQNFFKYNYNYKHKKMQLTMQITTTEFSHLIILDKKNKIK